MSPLRIAPDNLGEGRVMVRVSTRLTSLLIFISRSLPLGVLARKWVFLRQHAVLSQSSDQISTSQREEKIIKDGKKSLEEIMLEEKTEEESRTEDNRTEHNRIE